MKRRKFLQNSLLTSAGVMSGAGLMAQSPQQLAAAGQPFVMDFGIHDGMFRNNGGDNFLDQIRWAYDQGFRSIEDNGMMGRSVEEQKKIGDLLEKLGMRMGVFVIDSLKWNWKVTLTTGKQEWTDMMEKDCRLALETAKRCRATHATVVPGYFARELSYEMQTANVINALRKAAKILETGKLIMVLEPLSDNPDLFLRHSEQTFMICQGVGSPSCKILFDLYHMQRNEGDIIKHIERTWDEIGYFQIGDNPGRKEPTTGEMNYKNIFKYIHEKGYKGILGMEHGNSKPGKEGEEALIKAYREVDYV